MSGPKFRTEYLIHDSEIVPHLTVTFCMQWDGDTVPEGIYRVVLTTAAQNRWQLHASAVLSRYQSAYCAWLRAILQSMSKNCTDPTRRENVASGQGRLKRVQVPWKIFFRPPSKGRLTINHYTKSERPTVRCRVIWAWSEGVNFYNRQIMTLTRKIKTFATYSGPRPPSGPPVPGNLYQLPLPTNSSSRQHCLRPPLGSHLCYSSLLGRGILCLSQPRF
jgi:hypothetical protein